MFVMDLLFVCSTVGSLLLRPKGERWHWLVAFFFGALLIVWALLRQQAWIWIVTAVIVAVTGVQIWREERERRP